MGSKKRLMYWSGAQSTGADMRKYLTGQEVSHWVSLGQCAFVYAARSWRAPTVVDLLQCHDRVCRQALLRILVEQESLWCHRPRLRWRHRGVVLMMGGIHVGGGEVPQACCRPSCCGWSIAGGLMCCWVIDRAQTGV